MLSADVQTASKILLKCTFLQYTLFIALFNVVCMLNSYCHFSVAFNKSPVFKSSVVSAQNEVLNDPSLAKAMNS